MTETKILKDVKALKACRAGERVSFRARALRVWEMGGLRMCLVGDESALTRVELGEAGVEPGRSYEFRNTQAREYPSRRAGARPWRSASLVDESEVVLLTEDVPISQSEEYIEYTYKILAGVQRKKGRKEGRIAPWRHPAAGEPETENREPRAEGQSP